MTISDWLNEISVKFDELGFVPTTLTDEKSEHFVEWFATEISEIKKEEERLKAKQGLRRRGKMTEQEMVQKIYEVIKLVDCMQHNPSVDFNYLRAKGAYHIIKNQIEHIESENEQLKQTLSKMETVEKELKARLERAIELPVSVGDLVYDISGVEVQELKVQYIYTEVFDVGKKWVISCSHKAKEDFVNLADNVYGITWFTTKAEAEARLAELRKGEKE